jgi:diguanylate cyclase (GGDEF)-like protein
MEGFLLTAAALLSALVVVLAARLARGRERVRALERESGDLQALGQDVRRLEQEVAFFAAFIRQFTRLSNRLHSRLRIRRVPEVLMEIVVRTFEPEQALVLIRRKPTLAEPEREKQLVVASAHPDPRGIIGTTLSLGKGELGWVAESQRVMDDRDLKQKVPAGGGGGPSTLAGFRADLAAPMVIDQTTIGLIALARPHKKRSHAKDIIRLIAQTGATTLNNAQALSQIKTVADIDPLTGIANKRVLTYRLGELVYEAAQAGDSLAAFLFDIDHFKSYNDQNGHVAGDELLKLLARLVAEEVRADDVFGRFGGEEFLLILRDRGLQEAELVAEKIRLEIESFDFAYGDRQPLGRVTISGGVAVMPLHAGSSTDLVRAADAALYRAKEAGRNRVFTAAAPGTRAAAKVEPTSQEPQDEGDDLREIHGIGPAFEQALNRAGIRRFRQVARFGELGLEAIASHLDIVPERIVRDRWVEQARDLHREKYGERV